jgi:hypothetical protein
VSFNAGARYDYDKAYSAAQTRIDRLATPLA